MGQEHQVHDSETESSSDQGYQKDYSETGFWKKVLQFAGSAGKEVIEKALILFYVARSDKTPLWAKSIIFAALGYFINSIDGIPDITPVVGFADDLGVLVAAIASVAAFIRPDVKAKAEDKLEEWFGDNKPSGGDASNDRD